MLRRALVAASIVGSLACLSARAEAAGAWVSGAGSFAPLEQRVAVAVGPARTTLWTSLRFTSGSGPVAIVIPAPPGASLDRSSDAWLEALDEASAARVFPPASGDPYCSGKDGPPVTFEIAGEPAHLDSLTADDFSVLDDYPSLDAWAKTSHLTIPAAVAAQLGSLSGVRFLAFLYQAPGGTSVTPTVRVVMPGGAPVLPLALTRAGTDDLLVTAFLLGAGGGGLTAGHPVTVSESALVWKAPDQKTNYGDLRESDLAADSLAYLIESASPQALSLNVSIASGKASIDSALGTYFKLAAAYGDGNADPAPCVSQASAAFASGKPLSASCPRASLGVVDSAPPCAENPQPAEADPASLRCGTGADDLAVALSGLSLSNAWLTRASLEIAGSGQGSDWNLTFTGTDGVTPVLHATSIDYSQCGGPDGGAMSSSASASASSGMHGASSSGTGPHGFNTYGGISVSNEVTPGGDGTDLVDVVDDANDTSFNCSCTGTDTTVGDSSGSGSCDGSSDSSSSGSCSGDSSDGSSSCSGDSSGGDSCSSGSSGGDSCSGGGGGESCSGGGGGDSCSGGSGGNLCSVGARGIPRPKMSVLLLGALAVVAPLRRAGRKGRRGARDKKKR